MKNVKKYIFGSFLIMFASLLVILGCQNLFEPKQVKVFPEGKGGFLLRVDNAGLQRTIMPEEIKELALGDFDYTLEFFAAGTTTNPETFDNVSYAELTDPIDLDVGTWDLCVSAYVGTELSAKGWLLGIEIVEGRTAGGIVMLSPVGTGNGTGTFSWDIEYPGNIATASMTITPFDPNGTPEETYYLKGGISPLGPNAYLDDLIAGYYRVVFTNGTTESWSEILHIYDGLESKFTFTFVTYTVTFNSYPVSTVPTQKVRKGESAIYPQKPYRANFSFNNWYTTSGFTTIYDFNSPVTADITVYGKWDSPGIYMGIVKFADTAVDITNNSPMLVSTYKSNLVNYLNSSYKIASNIGTTMFYGVHKALANLKSNEATYPANLDSVHIITFTDGLDLSSRGVLMQAGNSIEGVTMANNVDYAAYIKDQINTRTINDVPIKAYSIGVRGTDLDQSDPGQVSMFYNNLESVASPNESYVFDDFSEVKIVFDDIKKGLNTSSTSTSFIMVSTLFDSGTKIRMTFDVDSNISAAGAASQRYIDATMQELTDGTRMLVDIEYSPGISSDAGAGPIFGAISGTEVTFVFNNINGYDASIDQTNTRQWVINPGFTSWVHNSEYKNNNSSATTIEKSSILIYLVLDCSTSLSENDISIIRTTAIDFINSLDQ